MFEGLQGLVAWRKQRLGSYFASGVGGFRKVSVKAVWRSLESLLGWLVSELDSFGNGGGLYGVQSWVGGALVYRVLEKRTRPFADNLSCLNLIRWVLINC